MTASTLAELLGRGDGYFKESDYEHAAEAFRQASLQYPHHPIAHFAYGHTLFALGRYAEAAVAIRDGMARYPDWGHVRMNRRDFYAKPAEFDEQLHHLEAWVERHPDDPNAIFVLGYHYYFTQQPDQARAVFERLINTNPHDEWAQYFLRLLVGATEI